MSIKNILVTGIGGVVGQGILRNISDMQLQNEIIGTNTIKVSAGNHLCDKVYEVPFAYDPSYIGTIEKICIDENVGLIIPSTDYESYYLAKYQSQLPCVVASCSEEVTNFSLDKYSNYQAFTKYGIPFAQSVLPSEYQDEYEKIIIKPREGRGSRGIHVDPANPKSFSDSNLIQEYLEGDELTTTFYVRKDGSLHGLITFKRELEQGNTSKAEVVFEYDEEILLIIKKMIKHYGYKGSCNIQSKVTNKGIIPFEINSRISGTNSVRAQFGFPDVAYTVQEHLLGKSIKPPKVNKGTALRIILDIIYPEITLDQINNKNDKFYIH